MRVEIKGLDKLLKQINELPKAVNKGVHMATYELTEAIEGNAKSNAQSNFQHPRGELSGSIYSDVDTEGGLITGAVWSDKAHSVFTEFGTGPVGQSSPKNLPDGVDPVYRQTPWFIPANKVDRNLNALYGIPEVEIKGKKFYFTHGQPARPWMWPAYQQGMEHADEIFKEHMQKALREGLK